MSAKEIRPEDIAYVIVTHTDKVDSSIPRNEADIYFGIIGEDN